MKSLNISSIKLTIHINYILDDERNKHKWKSSTKSGRIPNVFKMFTKRQAKECSYQRNCPCPLSTLTKISNESDTFQNTVHDNRLHTQTSALNNNKIKEKQH